MFGIVSMHDVAMHCPLIGDDNASRTQPAPIFAYNRPAPAICDYVFFPT